MAAIERLINRKVENRPVAGFEPGNGAQRAAAPRAAQPQHRQPRARNDRSQRNGRGPRPAQPRQPGGAWQERSASRQHFERARNHHRHAAPPAPINAEYQAQVEEARRRMRAEGEKPASSGPRRAKAVPALFARKPEVPEPQ
jgi:hypothetical protein